MKKISAKEKEEFELLIKEKFNLVKLRPFYVNNIENEYGKLLLCEYYTDILLNKERILIGCHRRNRQVFLAHLQREKNNFLDDFVNYNIIRHNDKIRSKDDIGYCLIEVLDADVLNEEDMYFVILASYHRLSIIENLYEDIVKAIESVIKKDTFSTIYWNLLSPSFPDRIKEHIF